MTTAAVNAGQDEDFTQEVRAALYAELSRYGIDPSALRAQMSTEDINDLPDSAFAYIEPGGTKDAQGKTVPRSKRHFPIHDAAHARNALTRAPQSPHGDKAMPAIRKAAKKFGIGEDSQRSQAYPLTSFSDQPAPSTYNRTFQLEDINIVSRAAGGDGRTVEAYAAVFDAPVEVQDQHGHYMERVDRGAFNKTLREGAITRAMVLYNHGLTAHGTPDMLGSVPLGRPLDIRVESRGLLTVSRYNKSQLADSVLEAIRNGDITSQSFRGRIYKSDPMRVPRTRPGQQLPIVRRLELGLTDYGPTPTPVYADAAITAVRSTAQIAEELAGLDPDQQAELLRTLSTTLGYGWEPETPLATPYLGAGPEEPRETHSTRSRALRLRAEALFKGVL